MEDKKVRCDYCTASINYSDAICLYTLHFDRRVGVTTIAIACEDCFNHNYAHTAHVRKYPQGHTHGIISSGSTPHIEVRRQSPLKQYREESDPIFNNKTSEETVALLKDMVRDIFHPPNAT